ncbi:carbohydrate ABC transporter permease [Planomonospora venezuelensis]|uniref:Multiple sugar transport system permease protein n=1 Tax=Planomonospora venezuelensis TaxID=1999 RepID=A0A841D1M9_PLAVE|nr:carbohydrate ABC transporter permease [Planomonospora venezuelensis]MBB5962308.1 multiple sugar transport system permease protein [Planomonospora venezuelensis]GIN00688.1 sugar ABC transporter permease [Planomonospora venezuelensis]
MAVISGAPGSRRLRPGRIALHAALAAGGLVMVFPFAWMLLTSFKGAHQMLNAPLDWLPRPWQAGNYPEAFGRLPFARAYWNSFYIAVLTVALTLTTSAMAAYAFARIRFRGSGLLFGLFLATQMVPPQVTVVPLYLMLSGIGWIDSHLALIVPGFVNPFAVFLLRQFIRAVPIELEEAARLDGAGRWTVFWRIVLPNIRPGLGALGIVVFLSSWNAFFFPLIFLNSPELATVPLLVSQFAGQHGAIDYGLTLAASAISIIPMMIAFLVGQRRILNSMAMSGLGGR